MYLIVYSRAIGPMPSFPISSSTCSQLAEFRVRCGEVDTSPSKYKLAKCHNSSFLHKMSTSLQRQLLVLYLCPCLFNPEFNARLMCRTWLLLFRKFGLLPFHAFKTPICRRGRVCSWCWPFCCVSPCTDVTHECLWVHDDRTCILRN